MKEMLQALRHGSSDNELLISVFSSERDPPFSEESVKSFLYKTGTCSFVTF